MLGVVLTGTKKLINLFFTHLHWRQFGSKLARFCRLHTRSLYIIFERIIQVIKLCMETMGVVFKSLVAAILQDIVNLLMNLYKLLIYCLYRHVAIRLPRCGRNIKLLIRSYYYKSHYGISNIILIDWYVPKIWRTCDILPNKYKLNAFKIYSKRLKESKASKRSKGIKGSNKSKKLKLTWKWVCNDSKTWNNLMVHATRKHRYMPYSHPQIVNTSIFDCDTRRYQVIAGFGIYTFLFCLIVYLIHRPIIWFIDKIWQNDDNIYNWCILLGGLIACIPIIICLFCCSVYLPILLLIENYNNCNLYSCDILLLLSMILSLVYIGCISYLFAHGYKVFLIVYSNIHLYCFYDDTIWAANNCIIPEIFVMNIINTYKNTPNRNKMIKDSFLGPDLGNIVIEYLPKYNILTSDELAMQKCSR